MATKGWKKNPNQPVWVNDNKLNKVKLYSAGTRGWWVVAEFLDKTSFEPRWVNKHKEGIYRTKKQAMNDIINYMRSNPNG